MSQKELRPVNKFYVLFCRSPELEEEIHDTGGGGGGGYIGAMVSALMK